MPNRDEKRSGEGDTKKCFPVPKACYPATLRHQERCVAECHGHGQKCQLIEDKQGGAMGPCCFERESRKVHDRKPRGKARDRVVKLAPFCMFAGDDRDGYLQKVSQPDKHGTVFTSSAEGEAVVRLVAEGEAAVLEAT